MTNDRPRGGLAAQARSKIEAPTRDTGRAAADDAGAASRDGADDKGGPRHVAGALRGAIRQAARARSIRQEGE